MTHLLTLIYSLFGGVAHAAIKSVNIIYPFPGSDTSFSDPVAYISAVYKFGLGLTGLFGFGALVWGGVNYVISGDNISKRTDARGQIRDAFIGILLLVSSVLILNEINPQILRTTLELVPATPSASSNNVPNGFDYTEDPELVASFALGLQTPFDANALKVAERFLALSPQARQVVLSMLDPAHKNILEQAVALKNARDEATARQSLQDTISARIQGDAAYRTQLQTSVQKATSALTPAQRQAFQNFIAQLPDPNKNLQDNLQELDRILGDPALRTPTSVGGATAAAQYDALLSSMNLSEEQFMYLQSLTTSELSHTVGTGATTPVNPLVSTGGTTDVTRFGVGGALRALPSSNRGSLTDVLRALPQGSTVQSILNSPFSATNAQVATIQNALSAMSLTDSDSFKAKTPQELLDLISKIQ